MGNRERFFEEAKRIIREEEILGRSGEVLSRSQDGVATCRFDDPVPAGAVIRFRDGLQGLVLSLNPEETVSVALLGDLHYVVPGDRCWVKSEVLEVPVGEAMLGRVVNALGQPIDGKGQIKTDEFRPVEAEAPGVFDRQDVSEPVMTGVTSIDSMVPIGRGQRELILGDRQIGRTAMVVDTIINQRNTDLFCVYVSVGQKEIQVRRLAAVLEEKGALAHTVIVSASAADPATLWYIAPFVGCAMGEYFMYRGQHVIVVYDDLSKHAWAWRQISTILRRPPGREAYPGDIFYTHSRLLERAAKLSDRLGGGSLTALPIIETQLSDVAAYIPTNVISITDGQIYVEPSLFFEGFRPAIDLGVSVSRVGGDAQFPALRRVSRGLKGEIASFKSLAERVKVDTNLDQASMEDYNRGLRVQELLKQGQYVSYTLADQVIMIFAIRQGYGDGVSVPDIGVWRDKLLLAVRTWYPEIIDDIETTKDFSNETEALLRQALEEFQARWSNTQEGAS